MRSDKLSIISYAVHSLVTPAVKSWAYTARYGRRSMKLLTNLSKEERPFLYLFLFGVFGCILILSVGFIGEYQDWDGERANGQTNKKNMDLVSQSDNRQLCNSAISISDSRSVRDGCYCRCCPDDCRAR